VNRRKAAETLSGFSWFTDDGHDIHPDFAQAHRLLCMVVPNAMSCDETDHDNPKRIKTAPWRSAAFGQMVECLDTWMPYLRSKQLMGKRGHPPLARDRSHGFPLVSSYEVNMNTKPLPHVVFNDTWYNVQHVTKKRKLATSDVIVILLIVSLHIFAGEFGLIVFIVAVQRYYASICYVK
jgi:hypothetical protein